MASEVLHQKYRPVQLKAVIGHNAVIKSLKSVVTDDRSHAFIFSGPSGTGKTTLARIAASMVDCDPGDVLEIDAATHSGAEEMRELVSRLSYRPLGGGENKAIIIDEAHNISKTGWDVLLKSLEEPPKWIYWFLCTTVLSKVPAAIKTRCVAYELQPVDPMVISEWLAEIAEAEKMALGADGDKIIDICVKEAYGSPRQALVNLATVGAATSVKDASELLWSAATAPEAIDLARALMSGTNFKVAAELIKKMKDANPESIRHVVRAYATTVALNAVGGQLQRAMAVLQAFSQPFSSSDGISPLVLAVGTLLIN